MELCLGEYEGFDVGLQNLPQARDEFAARKSAAKARLNSMVQGRCIGLVGGLGVGAATHYYRKLAAAHEQQGAALDLVMTHAEVPRVFEFVQASDRDGLARYLNGFIRRLQAAGAEFAVIPAVTPHYCIRELIALSPMPVLSIFEPLVRELSRRSIRRAAVFGTSFVMGSDLFGMAPGVELVHATPDEAEFIDSAYRKLAISGHGSAELHQEFTEIAVRICERDKVDAILFAGTDLSIIFNDENTAFPYIDCAALHIEAIVKVALGQAGQG